MGIVSLGVAARWNVERCKRVWVIASPICLLFLFSPAPDETFEAMLKEAEQSKVALEAIHEHSLTEKVGIWWKKGGRGVLNG